MLYYLFELLKKYDIPGQGLMTYFSFRAILANVIAIVIAYFFGKRVPSWTMAAVLVGSIIFFTGLFVVFHLLTKRKKTIKA